MTDFDHYMNEFLGTPKTIDEIERYCEPIKPHNAGRYDVAIYIASRICDGSVHWMMNDFVTKAPVYSVNPIPKTFKRERRDGRSN